MEKIHNPDILNCLANLSNDEVFTPPAVVEQMLDRLPQQLFSSPETRFLDPCSKSGVFLRQIAIRLIKGLATQIPDYQTRLNHIFQNQLFGLAITELTALISRRTVYCSKQANHPKYSVAKSFFNLEGNILLPTTSHKWANGRCEYCNANQQNYQRGQDLETYAYPFIHHHNPKSFFNNMKFDVIIGNPPYHLKDGGAQTSASPLYHKFVEQAKAMNPRYISMIIPARWYAGGKGLDEFRKSMLNDNHISQLVDFVDANDCFPKTSADISGGVCYFLWDRDYKGACQITNKYNGLETVSKRFLNEFPTLIRFALAAQIVKKVQHFKERSMNAMVSSRKPFGLATDVKPLKSGDIKLISHNGEGFYWSKSISVGVDLISKYKVITSKTSYDHAGKPDKEGKRRIFSRIKILPPNFICTETYIVVGSFNNIENAKNLYNFLLTKFARFLVSLLSFSQDITKERFAFVPMQDFSREWTDKDLYEKYGLDEAEIGFIESMIKPMAADSAEEEVSEEE